MTNAHRVVAITFLLLAAALPASAGENTIATDRPDFVESSDVVGKGRFQLETSLAWERDRQGGLKTRMRSTPTLLRIGTGEDWELRFETDGSLRVRSSEGGITTSERGWSDLSLGIKWHTAEGDEESGKPGVAWLFHLDVKSGSRAFRATAYRPSVRMVAEWELPNGWSAGLMPGLYADRNEQGKRYVGGIMAAVLGKSITERLRGFVELSAQEIASTKNGGNVLTFDAGMAYLLADNMQIDVAVTRGLNKTTPDLGWTVGFSAKF